MLDRGTSDYLKEEIKRINSLKNIDHRLDELIKTRQEINFQFNDYLDELFSAINLKKLKLNLEE